MQVDRDNNNKMQNSANRTYKISSLSPTFTTRSHLTQRHPFKSSTIQPYSSTILEDQQQAASSPSPSPDHHHKNSKNKEKHINRNRKHRQRHRENMSNNLLHAVVQGVEEVRQGIREVANRSGSVPQILGDECGELGDAQDGGGVLRKLNFVEMYRNNLRNTVFNETKLMLQTKKQQAFPKSSINSSTNSPYGELVKKQKKQQNPQRKQSVHSQQPQKASIDSLYRTITNTHKAPVELSFEQLEIAKFPLITRTRRDSGGFPRDNGAFGRDTLNYSNLLNALNMREKDLQQVRNKLAGWKKESPPKAKPARRDEKPELRGWDTFADQFLQ